MSLLIILYCGQVIKTHIWLKNKGYNKVIETSDLIEYAQRMRDNE